MLPTLNPFTLGHRGSDCPEALVISSLKTGGSRMSTSRPSRIYRRPAARTTFNAVLALVTLAGVSLPWELAAAQERAARDAVVKQVADDIYFFFDFNGSNSVFLVTADGVLVIDTRTHPHE